MDSFTIGSLSSLFDFNHSYSLIAIGMEGIGKITLALWYLTSKPMKCNAEDKGTLNTGWLVPGG